MWDGCGLDGVMVMVPLDDDDGWVVCVVPPQLEQPPLGGGELGPDDMPPPMSPLAKAGPARAKRAKPTPAEARAVRTASLRVMSCPFRALEFVTRSPSDEAVKGA